MPSTLPAQSHPARRALLLGSLFYSLYWGAIGVFEPFINIHLLRLNFSGFQIGVLNALLPLVILIVSPLLSALADRKAWRRRIVIVCCVGMALGLLLLAPLKSFPLVLAVFALLALSRGPTAPIGDALVLRLASRYTIDYGKMRLWGSFFFAALSAVFGFIWEKVGMAWMFPVGALMLLLIIPTTARMEESQAVHREAKFPWRILIQDRILLLLFIAALMMGAATIMFLFYSLYLTHLGASEWMVGLLMGVIAMAEVPVMHYGDRWIRRLGGLRALLLAFGFFALSFIGGFFAWAPWVLLITGTLNGAGFGLGFVAIVVTFDQRTPDNWSASIQALLNAGMFGVAPFLSSLAYGAIFDAWPAGVFIFSLELVLAAIAAVLAAMRWDKRKPV
jgi:MFS family permease